MRLARQNIGRFAWLLPLMAILGCWGSAGKTKRYDADVRGTITFDGQPLRMGTVTFIPVLSESQGGRPGIARIENDGAYVIGNANGRSAAGVRPGKYRVTVLVMDRPTHAGEFPKQSKSIPHLFSDPKETPLLAEVAAGNNRIDIELTQNSAEARVVSHLSAPRQR